MKGTNIIRLSEIIKEPASHEDSDDPGVLKQVLLRRDDIPPGRIQMVNWATMSPRKSFQPHEYRSMEEIYIILSGTAKIRIGGEEAVLQKGDAVVIPPQATHAMINIGDEPIEYIVIGVATDE